MIRYIACLLLVFVGVFYVSLGDNIVILQARKCGDIIVEEYDENVVLNVCGDYMKLLKLLGVVVNKKIHLEDRVVIEGYTPKLNNFININGRKINIQLSIVGDNFLVGYPLIENSF
jgi:hypothetical protein